MSKPLPRVHAGQDRASLYDQITDKIIAELEAGRVPWVQPWGTVPAKAPLAMPKNASTDRTHGSINVLLLWGASLQLNWRIRSGSVTIPASWPNSLII